MPRSCRAATCWCSSEIRLDQRPAVRIRRIALGEIKPGALVDGAVLFEADLGYEIDNMEGLSVHRSAGGEIVLTLISDDNSLPSAHAAAAVHAGRALIR